MKLRNKKTGEIVILIDHIFDNYTTIAELNEEWEDYEEPKDIWWLDNEGSVNHASGDFNDSFRKNRKIGNYFLSREEAEEAVEKLKAWKRLKDKGFKFEGWDNDQSRTLGDFVMYASIKCLDDIIDDLNFLFGGEE